MADGGMVSIGGVSFEVIGDLEPARRAMTQAKREAERSAGQMGDAFERASGRTNQSFQRAGQSARNFNREISGVASNIRGLGPVASSVVGGTVAAALTAGAIAVVRYSDAWVSARNQMASAGVAMSSLASTQASLLALANDTRTSLTSTTDLFSRLTRATSELGRSQAEVTTATRIINQAFKSGGGSVAEQTSAIIQLGQALGSGVLQGDELRSIRENSPLLAQAIAREFGVTVGELKKLGEQGELEAQRVFDAILKIGPEVQRQFDASAITIGDRITVIGNKLAAMGGRFGEALGLNNPDSDVNNFLRGIERVLDGAGTGGREGVDANGVPLTFPARLADAEIRQQLAYDRSSSGRPSDMEGLNSEKLAFVVLRQKQLIAESAALEREALDAQISVQEKIDEYRRKLAALEVSPPIDPFLEGRKQTQRDKIAAAEATLNDLRKIASTQAANRNTIAGLPLFAFLPDDLAAPNNEEPGRSPTAYTTGAERLIKQLDAVRAASRDAAKEIEQAGKNLAAAFTANDNSEAGLRRLVRANDELERLRQNAKGLEASRSAVTAILDFGTSGLENVPRAMLELNRLGKEGVVSPRDVALAGQELRKYAEESTRAFGSDATRAKREHADAIREMAIAEAALAAVGDKAGVEAIAESRAIADQTLRDATRQWVDDFSELAQLITDVRSPTEALAEELAALGHLMAGEAPGSPGYVAGARRRIELLQEEARQAGLARDALAQLRALAPAAGLNAREQMQAAQGIRSAANEGREGRFFLTGAQSREAAAQAFTDIWTQSLVNGVRSGDFGEALESAALDALSNAFAGAIQAIGEYLANSVLGLIDGIESGGAAVATDALATSAATGAISTDALATSMAIATPVMDLLAASAGQAAAALAAVAAAGASESTEDFAGWLAGLSGGVQGRARGGSVSKGTPYIVGERGHELFIPTESGSIVPHHMLMQGAQVGGGLTKLVAPSINMGDIVIQGDVGTGAMLQQLREQQEAQARALPRVVRQTIAEQRRRS